MKLFVNVLSTFRLIVGFFIIYFVVIGSWKLAFYLVIAGLLSDLVDGPIARRFCVDTPGGKALDLTADIVLDQCVIGALFITGAIGLNMELTMALAIIFIRFGAFSDPRLYGFSIPAFPIYSVGMIWLISKHYALNAFGLEGLEFLIGITILVTLIIIYLKRERIMADLKKTSRVLSGK